MLVRFHIHFHTSWGQQLFVCGSLPSLGDWEYRQAAPMQYQSDGRWELTLDVPDDIPAFSYKYILFHEPSGGVEWEFGADRVVEIKAKRFSEIDLQDVWRSPWEEHNALYSSAFTRVIMRRPSRQGRPKPVPRTGSVHRFQLRAPRIAAHLKMCLLGQDEALGNWDESRALIMDDQDFPLWQVDVPLRGTSREISYKYAIYDEQTGEVKTWEQGEDRVLRYEATRKRKQLTIVTDEMFRYPLGNWKGAGVAIPVFSLRSQQSGGVGEFADLKLLVDWARATGLRLVQILPINDTVATHTFVDSYPYSAISVYALHPMFAHMPAMGRLQDAELQAAIDTQAARLNALPDVDYVEVMKLKSRFFKALYDQERDDFLADPAFREFFAEQAHWLRPYAAFSALRDRFGTADFKAWAAHSTFDRAAIEAYTAEDQPHYDDIAIHYFIQYHLHRQMLDAATYAREHGVVLKGDIPIGIYRHSVDAWVAPHLYHMDAQAGAPPDAFAREGQNWRFPTYNWEVMAKDGYAWWRSRMTHMARYFDAYRIDHILGFFRIWEIPGHAVQGIMGQFNPSLPFSRDELAQRGVWLDDERFLEPYIRAHMLPAYFGDLAESVAGEFLDQYQPGCYRMKPQFATQRQVEAYVEEKMASYPESRPYFEAVTPGLYSLISEVIFFRAPGPGEGFNPRIAMQHTYSFRELDGHVQDALNALYNDYFYHRHDQFWREQALVKLPAIRNATDMLVCGEDLGMVPASVPGVMRELGLLSLEIQRMPKDPKQEFFHPADAPYLSVVSTSTHDMPTLRGWWEEDRDVTQGFFNRILGKEGEAPYFCEPWIAQMVLIQHLHSPSMWAILPLQDLLAIDGELRRENPQEEQINVPANPRHYWRYRMHVSLEDLLAQEGYNRFLRGFVEGSGRNSPY
ncbi:MAG: 4-alpha-glucanotransferase [Bacteroidetes bacterium]|nr:MAG: 4-alpha-glucanotransferase [Bacteroidota bacterium]